MKITLFTLCILFVLQTFAQIPEHSQDTLSNTEELIIISPDHRILKDSPRIKILSDTINKHKENSINELFIIGKNAYKKGHSNKNSQYARFKGHWSGFQYGFVNFTNTDYSMYKGTEYEKYGEFMELDWSNSFAMQFNILKYSINLSPRNNFGLIWGLGLEYQRLRFKNNYRSITWTDTELIPVDLHANPDIANVKRSTFKTLYLTIPLLMEVQFPASNRKKLYVSGGIMGGVRMHSKTKIIYKDQNGNEQKKKEKDNFNMIPFKADAVGRIGYSYLNVWGSYTLTNMFKSGEGPELHAYTIGLGVTF